MSTLSAIMFAKRRSEVKTEHRKKAIVKYSNNVQKRLKENENNSKITVRSLHY